MACTSGAQAPAPAEGNSVGSGGFNAPQQQDKPYLVMISLDGFRWDYPDLHSLPALQSLIHNGVRAERLIPVFPTLTFPNHYSLVTGLYPASHGIVANEFPIGDEGYWYRLRSRESVQNGSNYHGEPLWVTAEKQGMVSAAFFWVGSEADIMGIQPTHWRLFDKGIAGPDRVDQVLAWLAEPPATRPHLVNLYFEHVDDYTHWYGPDSDEGGASAARVDGYLQRLIDGLDRLPHGNEVNIVVVSDHGQASYRDSQELQVLDELVNLDGITVVEGGCYLFLHFDQADPERAVTIRDTVNARWSNGRAWLPSEAPTEWHIDDNPRFPDLLIVADVGYAVLSSIEAAEYMHPGDHGWPPEAPEMHGVFVASGPAFKQGYRLGPVRNVDVYPALVRLLGLDPPAPVDSDPRALENIFNTDF
jgi:predicted AlkP superfamily pyrophosphatase or phosphodiesterase